MSEDQKKQLQTQLWNIANELRGKMGADEFRDYILGFIFYKYLSEKIELYANSILKNDSLTYEQVIGHKNEGAIIEEVQKATIDELGGRRRPDFSQAVRAAIRAERPFADAQPAFHHQHGDKWRESPGV